MDEHLHNLIKSCHNPPVEILNVLLLMKKLLALAAAAMLAGAGCSANVDVQPADTTPSDDQAMMDSYDDHAMDGMEMDADTHMDSDSMEAHMETDTKVTTPVVNTTVTTDTTTTAPAASAVLKLTMEAGNFFFSPKSITAAPGQQVEITFNNVVGTHNFTIDGIVSKPISNGTVLTFTAPSTAGSVAFYCNIGPHRSLGMEGTLMVK